MKDDLSQKIQGNMINISGTAKNDGTHPRKDDTGVLDQRSTKSSNNSLYLYGWYLLGIFICWFPMKKPGSLIYRTEIWLYLQVIWFAIFYNEESSILCNIQPSGAVFRGVPECQLRKKFAH